MTPKELRRLRPGSPIMLNGKIEYIKKIGYFINPLTFERTLGVRLVDYGHSAYVGHNCIDCLPNHLIQLISHYEKNIH